ncbi:MAG TPA: LCP family protein [Firmicutes bacterium]|nr:LCP family protein [Bacillota bacterium]
MLPREEYEKRMEELDRLAAERKLQQRKQTRLVILVILFAVVLTCLAAWLTYYFQIYWDVPRSQRLNDQRGLVFEGVEELTTILVMGGDIIDREEGRTDTMFVLGYLPNRDFVSIFTIPRDTLVEVDGVVSRINELNGRGGPGLAMDCVEELLGIEIDYYILLNFQAFEKIIDILGGVEIQVERDMKYDDHAGNLHIDIPAGLQVLDGRTALEYIRYRGDGLGDITAADPLRDQYKGRVVRQQKFLSALQRQILRPRTVLHLPALLFTASQSLKTNLPLWKAVGVLRRFFDSDDVRFGVVPGGEQRIGGASYWVADPNVLPHEVIGTFTGVSRPEVVVLNGSGVRGIAAAVAGFLRQNGYKIEEIGNADHYEYQHTQISYRDAAQREHAERVRVLMGGVGLIREDEGQRSDLLVIIGKDYEIPDLL